MFSLEVLIFDKEDFQCLIRIRDPLCWKSASVTCVFSCDLRAFGNVTTQGLLFVCLHATHTFLLCCLFIWRIESGSHAWIIHFQGRMHQCQEIESRGRLFCWKPTKVLLEDGRWARTHAVERTQRCHVQKPTLRSLRRLKGIQIIQSHMAKTNLTSRSLH